MKLKVKFQVNREMLKKLLLDCVALGQIYWRVDGSALSARKAAELFITIANADIQRLALRRLTKINNQLAINQIWEVWQTTRHAKLAEFLIEQGVIASEPLELKLLSALLAQRQELLHASDLATYVLLIQLCQRENDLALARRASELLQTPSDELLIELAAQPVSQIPELLLADLMAVRDFIAAEAAAWRVLVALRVNRPELLALADESILAPLLQLHDSSDQQLAMLARQTLLNLQRAETQDAFCRLAFEPEQETARKLVLEADYQPHNKHERALFLFLTRQWQRYESLDFDQSLLKFIFDASGATVRQRVIDTAREAGRVELVTLLAGNRQNRSLRNMSEDEWQLIVELLVRGQRWDEAWELVLSAPPLWSLRIMRQLAQVADWQPNRPAEQVLYNQLKTLAQDWNTAYPPLDDYPPLGRQLKVRAKNATNTTEITSVASLPGDSKMVIGYVDGTIRLWDVFNDYGPQLLKDFGEESKNHSNIQQLSSNGTNLVLTVKKFAITPSKPDVVATLEGNWTNANNATYYWRGSLFMRDVTDWHIISTIQANMKVNIYYYYYNYNLEVNKFLDKITNLAFSPDGEVLVCHIGNDLRLWNINNYSQIKRFNDPSHIFSGIKFSPNGKLVAVKADANRIMIWRVKDGEILGNFTVESYDWSGGNIDLLFARDNRTLICSNREGHIFCILHLPDIDDIKAWSKVGLRQQPSFSVFRGHHHGIYSMALSPDEQILATGHREVIRLWHLPTRRPIKTVYKAHRSEVKGLMFSKDGQQLVSVGQDGQIKVWSTRLIEVCQTPVAQTKISDLLFARQSQRDPSLTDAERYWLIYLETLLGWQYQHEIELDDVLPITASEFDIVLESVEG